jgi:hypothetical protein
LGKLFAKWLLLESLIQQKVLSQQAECLMRVGTKTVTVIFFRGGGKEWKLKTKNFNLSINKKNTLRNLKLKLAI